MKTRRERPSASILTSKYDSGALRNFISPFAFREIKFLSFSFARIKTGGSSRLTLFAITSAFAESSSSQNKNEASALKAVSARSSADHSESRGTRIPPTERIAKYVKAH